MAALKLPITLEEGSDFNMHFKYVRKDFCTAINVASYGATFTIKNEMKQGVSALLIASVANARISVASGSIGLFKINLPAASVNAVKNTLDRKRAEYRFVVFPDASSASHDPVRLGEGRVRYSED